MTQRGKAYNIAIIGILGALIILQAYIPMVGYVQIFPAWPAISTIHLTVIIGGIVLMAVMIACVVRFALAKPKKE